MFTFATWFPISLTHAVLRVDARETSNGSMWNVTVWRVRLDASGVIALDVCLSRERYLNSEC